MTIKCSECGFVCDKNSNFCPNCGAKLKSDNKNVIQTAIKQFDTKENVIVKEKIKTTFTSSKAKAFFDNSLISVSLFLIALLCGLCLVMYFVLDSHKSQKQILGYKNLIENPSLIPLLKEPADYQELANNIADVEKFLLMYLKNASDNQEKKNQVFISYLSELDKLPNVLNEKFDKENISLCSNSYSASACVSVLNKKFEKTGVNVFLNQDYIVLYPDYKFIKNIYEEFLDSEFKQYVDLRAKYNYPTSLGLNLNIKPIKLADMIFEYEKLYLKTQNELLKETIEKILYFNVRKFVFTPSIYSTMTQEMKPEYKKAYEYYIKTKKKSNLKPFIMSYYDKKRSYSESNFENDYPYKMFNKDTFDESYKNSILEDVFVQLRKNIFTNKNLDIPLAYVYDLKNAKWKRYNSQNELSSGEFVLSEPDENNNVSIYNHAFSPMQELNILKYSKMYLIADGLYVFNKDKLAISKVTFNGKTFNLYNMNHIDVTSLFPGIEVINIDSFPSYNVVLEKANKNANYIILSRYSQGWNEYEFVKVKGEFNQLALPNMFSVSSNSDVIISFTTDDESIQEFSENKPAYKFTIKTAGEKEEISAEEKYSQYDEKTKNEEAQEEHKANIMPKLKPMEEKIELDEDFLLAPEQKIDPPKENE